jgi:uncharacterized protein Yka (UPF0111/DUF47 family)
MTEKARIIRSLGEPDLLLPALLNAGLAANDRAKYYFTLLQAAAARARHPDAPFSNLRRERLASGVDDESWDETVAGSTLGHADAVCIPGAARLIAALVADVEAMLAPIGARAEGDLQRRFASLRDATPAAADDVLDPAAISAMTSGSRERGDSLHLVVMDAHKALNALQGEIASESIDGASAYNLEAADRPRVAAFMRGLQRTAPLKFEHPGLGTTATRSAGRLVLQNDIGTTDAHVLVVHVDALRVTVTYTDVHLQRLLFFQGMFGGRGASWEDTRSRRDDAMEDGVYHLCVGTFDGADEAQVQEHLAYLGSRLVFLIDWNKARKRLRALVAKGETLRLLAWAAEHDHGHMAFLKAGGEQLIYDALDFAGRGEVRFGERLDDILGPKDAALYLRFVLKACAQSLLRGEPESFIQDEVRAELFNYFRTSRQRIHDIAAEHAALVVEMASGIRDSLLELHTAEGVAALRANAERTKAWEHEADELVNRARAMAKQAGSPEAFCAIVELADDVADELEEAAFHLTLLPPGRALPGAHRTVQQMGKLLVQGAQEYVKVIAAVRDARRGGAREDMQDFLDAEHRIMAIEHQTDEAQRSVAVDLVAQAGDFLAFHVLTEAARNLEQAADALMHCSLRLRDYVMGEAMAA